MKFKRTLSMILCIITILSSLSIAATFSASANSHSYIFVDASFTGSTFNFGETIEIPAKLYSLGYDWEKYYVEVHNESGDSVFKRCEDYFPSNTLTNLTLTFDSEGYVPGKYYVYFWSTYETSYKYDSPIYFTINEPTDLVYRETQSGSQKGVKNNLSKPQSAWIATSADANDWSLGDSQPYQIRLEELIIGEYADAFAHCESSSSDKPIGKQHWIIFKFWLKNTGTEEIEGSDVINAYDDIFFSKSGASLSLVDYLAHFYGTYKNMGPYDLTLQPGASGYFYYGILPREEITFPLIRIHNGYHKKDYSSIEDYTWLKTDLGSTGTLKKVDGQWRYYVGGKFTKATTLVKYNGAWYYVKNGVMNSANTLVKYNGKWYHVNKGKWVKDTTLVKYGSSWHYVKDGIKNNANTLVKYNGKWYHVNKGVWVKDTTLVKYGSNWHYVKNGIMNTANTLVKYNNKWYHVNKGKWVKDTTLVKYNNAWYYVKDGIMNSANTLVKYNGKWYHVNKGKCVKDTTLVKYGSEWYYVKDGIKNDANTLVKYNNKWYHVNKGVWVKDTTLVKYSNKWFYVKDGIVNGANTLVKFNGKWYHVNGGNWVKDTTLVKYASKYHYVKGGIKANVTGNVKIGSKTYKLKNGVMI